MPSLTPISDFLDFLQSADDPDLIRASYGDFVRQAFREHRVLVMPNRSTAEATPRLSQGEDLPGRPARARLSDDLVMLSGPLGSLGPEHLQWLTSLREATETRLQTLRSLQGTDAETGLGSERKFHEFLRLLSRKEPWFGWMMNVTLKAESQPPVEQVRAARQQVVDFLRRRHPAGSQLYRLDDGQFAGLVPGLEEADQRQLADELAAGIAALEPGHGVGFSARISTAPWPSQTGYPRAFWFRLKGGLEIPTTAPGAENSPA